MGPVNNKHLLKGTSYSIIIAVCTTLIVSLSFNYCQADNKYYFDFKKDLQGWRSWGEGEALHIESLGHTQKGAIQLSCGDGQQETLYREFKLDPGRYKVSAWIRALDVKKGKYDYSIWLFYKTAGKIVSPVTGLYGTFEWSKVEYTIEVGTNLAQIWFRLKSPGTIWLDDVSIVPYSEKPIAFNYVESELPFPSANPPGTGVRCQNCYRWVSADNHYCSICGYPLADQEKRGNDNDTAPEVKLLMNFEPDNRGLENKRHNLRKFSNITATSGQFAAVVEYGKYNTLNISSPEMRNWSSYDYMSMDVFSPVDQHVRFSLALGDYASDGYWNQLNHYSTLSRGWNKLKFKIRRYVGERGSVRFKRYLDLSRLKKVWFGIDPEKTLEFNGEFLIDNVRLEKAVKHPEKFDELQLFDFVKEKFRTQNGFIGIESKHDYNPDIGFGFVNTTIWRTHDSLYADTLFRDGIFVNSGSFRVDLPNGQYIVRLVPYALGEWYEHFWTHRSLSIQGKTYLEEKRTTAEDYLDDFLRFSEIEPTPEDNPYDLYLKKILKEIVAEVEVKNNKLLIDFEGDDSGIMLNSLIIYPKDRQMKGGRFVKQLESVQKEEFEYICRRIENGELPNYAVVPSAAITRGFYTALIDSDVQLRYNQILPSNGSSIHLSGGKGQRPVQALMVRSLTQKGELKISLSPLHSSSGEELTADGDWIRYGVAQYQSHTMNHETYELAPRFLRRFPPTGLELRKEYSLLLWLQIPVTDDMAAGTYTAELNLEMHGEKVIYPVKLEILEYKLSDIDFAVGFFGLDPVQFDYFNGENVHNWRKEYRYKALTALRQRGFTTWSGLPDSEFDIRGDVWAFKAAEIDDIMEKARALGFKHKIFTYGGNSLIDLKMDSKIKGIPAIEYRRKSSLALREHIEHNNWLPIVVDISDEAAGYSQTVERDKKRAEMMREFYPFLRRGGYTHPIDKGKPGYDLNLMFTDISLSSVSDDYLDILRERNIRWGKYGGAGGLFTNDGKFISSSLADLRAKGCDHYLGWHGTLAQNYPYYDLDGREHDAMMFFPRRDGGLDFALKFEWAALGLEKYRLLKEGHQMIEAGGTNK